MNSALILKRLIGNLVTIQVGKIAIRYYFEIMYRIKNGTERIKKTRLERTCLNRQLVSVKNVSTEILGDVRGTKPV